MGNVPPSKFPVNGDIPPNVPVLINEFAIDENVVRRRFLNDLVNVLSSDENVSVRAQTSLMNKKGTTDSERFMILSVCSRIPTARFNDTKDRINDANAMTVWENKCIYAYYITMTLNGRAPTVRIDDREHALCFQPRSVHFTPKFETFLKTMREETSTATNVYLDFVGYEKLERRGVPLRIDQSTRLDMDVYGKFVRWSIFIGLDVFAPNIETVVVATYGMSAVERSNDIMLRAPHDELRTLYDVSMSTNGYRPAMKVQCVTFYDYVGEGGTLSTFADKLRFASKELWDVWCSVGRSRHRDWKEDDHRDTIIVSLLMKFPNRFTIAEVQTIHHEHPRWISFPSPPVHPDGKIVVTYGNLYSTSQLTTFGYAFVSYAFSRLFNDTVERLFPRIGPVVETPNEYWTRHNEEQIRLSNLVKENERRRVEVEETKAEDEKRRLN